MLPKGRERVIALGISPLEERMAKAKKKTAKKAAKKTARRAKPKRASTRKSASKRAAPKAAAKPAARPAPRSVQAPQTRMNFPHPERSNSNGSPFPKIAGVEVRGSSGTRFEEILSREALA